MKRAQALDSGVLVCNPAASLHEAEKTPPEDKADTKKNIKEEAKTPAALHAIGFRAMQLALVPKDSGAMKVRLPALKLLLRSDRRAHRQRKPKRYRLGLSFVLIPFKNSSCHCGPPVKGAECECTRRKGKGQQPRRRLLA